MTIQKTRNQEYSDLVFPKVQNRVPEKKDDEKLAGKYKSLCKRSGGVLRTVGLIQFLTFLQAKAGKEEQHGYLLDDLAYELEELGLISSSRREDCLAKVRAMRLPQYMRATSVVLLLLQWHRRFAEVLITVNTDGED